MKTNKIVIVDDHPICLYGLELAISKMTNYQLVAKCMNTEAALSAIKIHQPQLVITDLAMPERDGFMLIKQVKKLSPTIKILVFTMFDQVYNFNKAIEGNVNGYVVKGEPMSEVENAINAVLQGQTYYSAIIKNSVSALFENTSSNKQMLVLRLTNREKQILQMIYQEKTTKEIAAELELAFGTIETYRNSLLKKFGCNNMIGLIKIAQAHNLL